jgi:putative ABC transport system permease protein
MRLAYRNLFQNKTRLALSLGGVALAVMLILLLNGLLAGMNTQITSYLKRTPGEILVAQSGVSNLLGATSLLPTDILDSVQQTAGVEKAIPILSQFVILDLHGKKQPAYLVGYDTRLGGGPWELVEGRQPETEGEMVFDQVLARRHEIQVGDTYEVIGKSFEIVGLSEDTTSWMTSFIFIPKTAAESLLRAPGSTSFVLVAVNKTHAVEEVQRGLDEIPGADALLKTTVAANDLKLFAKVFSAPLRLMVGIAFLVGVLVVGLVIYTATIERQREYGALKAIGARNSVLYQVVAAQALFSALSGSLVGVLLAYGAGQVIMLVRPQFLVTITPEDAAVAFASGLAMALAAAIFPARVIAGLAPAEVFRR